MAFQQGPIRNFIGQGLIFPIELENGRGKLFTGFDLLRSSIKVILSWPYNQRFLLGQFGSRLEDVLEEPNDDVLHNLVYTFVTDAIATWEKRIELVNVELIRNDQRASSSLSLSLTYRIINSQIEDNFVFPFYRKIIY